MSPHKKVFMEFYDYTEGDFIPCSIYQQPAVDIHAIQREGMGGDNNMVRIENLIPLCRQHHTQLGDRNPYKAMMYKIVFYELMKKDFDDFSWLVSQINKYETT